MTEPQTRSLGVGASAGASTEGLDSMQQHPLGYSALCAVCGLTYGSHRADSTVPDQCPAHEGRMDWPREGITTFRDSGEHGEVPYGTPAKRRTAATRAGAGRPPRSHGGGRRRRVRG